MDGGVEIGGGTGSEMGTMTEGNTPTRNQYYCQPLPQGQRTSITASLSLRDKEPVLLPALLLTHGITQVKLSPLLLTHLHKWSPCQGQK